MTGEKQVYGIRGGLAHDAGSGSFVSWDNTKCNPLAPAREQARSAWEDGYASAKREWVGLATEEARKFYESDLSREELIHKIDEFLEEKNT